MSFVIKACLTAGAIVLMTDTAAMAQVSSPEAAVDVFNRAISGAGRQTPEELAEKLDGAFAGILAMDEIVARILGGRQAELSEAERLGLKEDIRRLFAADLGAMLGTGGDARRSLSIRMDGAKRRLDDGAIAVPIRLEGRGLGLGSDPSGSIVMIEDDAGRWSIIDTEIDRRSILASQVEGMQSTVAAAGGDIGIVLRVFNAVANETRRDIEPVRQSAQ